MKFRKLIANTNITIEREIFIAEGVEGRGFVAGYFVVGEFITEPKNPREPSDIV